MRSVLAAAVVLCACGEGERREIESALALLKSADADDRFEAVVRLGGVASEEAGEALLRAVKDQDPAVRLLAGIALLAADREIPDRTGKMDGPLLTPNPGKAPPGNLTAAEQLVYADPWFAGTLLPGCILAASDKDERVRALGLRALEILGRKEPRDFRAVTRAAGD